MSTGFRIYTQFDRPAKELIEGFRNIPVANIADIMNRLNCLDAKIKPCNTLPLLGTAFTIKSRTADNLLFHKALDMALPGDVIIVDVQGDLVNAVFGEIMATYARKRGIAGIVIDGAIRDKQALAALDLPVYAAGCTPKGPYKDGPGEINVPVSCGGIVIRPGDIIVGDADGIVVINPADGPDILQKARVYNDKEHAILAAIENGTLDRSWIDEVLKQKGCEFIEGKHA